MSNLYLEDGEEEIYDRIEKQIVSHLDRLQLKFVEDVLGVQ